MGIIDDLTFDQIIEGNEKNSKKGEQSLEFHIIQSFCEIPKGKEIFRFALVQFGNYERYDIRNWYDKACKPGKGISLTKEELSELYLSLKDRDLTHYNDELRATYKSDKVSASIYELICHLSDYSVKDVQWNKELSIIDWGHGPKYDFRRWTNDYSKCSKGITVSFECMKILYNEIKKICDNNS